MKVAVGQFRAGSGTVSENLKKAEALAAEGAQKGARVLVLPETMDWGYGLDRIRDDFQAHQEVEDQLAKISAQHGLLLAAGIVARVGQARRNRQLVCANGKVVSNYDKLHLFSLGATREQDVFEPGEKSISFDWNGVKFGSLICFDLRFPELSSRLREMGVLIFLTSSAWPAARADVFRTLVRARAIENQCFMVSANQAGLVNGLAFAGHSSVIGPDGGILAELSPDFEGVAVAEIQLNHLEEVRRAMPMDRCRNRILS